MPLFDVNLNRDVIFPVPRRPIIPYLSLMYSSMSSHWGDIIRSSAQNLVKKDAVVEDAVFLVFVKMNLCECEISIYANLLGLVFCDCSRV